MLIIKGQAQIGAFILVYSSSTTMLDGSENVYLAFGQLKLASSYIGKWREHDKLKDTESEMYNGSLPTKIDIKFENVSFKYESSKKCYR